MSSNSTPIPLHRFAEAIRDLPLSNLHLKAAELDNSIAHLDSSNQQLKQYADDGDQYCLDAIRENLEVMVQMRERISLLRQEVEHRGFRWEEQKMNETKPGVNGETEHNSNGLQEVTEQTAASILRERHQGGSLTDEELALRLQERIGEDRTEDTENTEGGVHL